MVVLINARHERTTLIGHDVECMIVKRKTGEERGSLRDSIDFYHMP